MIDVPCGRCSHLVFPGRIQQRGDVQVKVLHSPWIGWKAELPYAAGQTRNVLLWQKPVEFPVSRAVCEAGYCQFPQCLDLAVSIKAGYCQFWQCLYLAVRLGTASSAVSGSGCKCKAVSVRSGCKCKAGYCQFQQCLELAVRL